MRDSGSMDEYRADGLALVGATGNGEDEDEPTCAPAAQLIRSCSTDTRSSPPLKVVQQVLACRRAQ
jgi:hypothetical protein